MWKRCLMSNVIVYFLKMLPRLSAIGVIYGASKTTDAYVLTSEIMI